MKYWTIIKNGSQRKTYISKKIFEKYWEYHLEFAKYLESHGITNSTLEGYNEKGKKIKEHPSKTK